MGSLPGLPPRRLLALLGAIPLAVVLSAGCSEDPVTREEAPKEWTACQETEECQIIDISCCSGGWFSVNKTYADHAYYKMRVRDCDGSCSSFHPTTPFPTCEAGVCKYTRTRK